MSDEEDKNRDKLVERVKNVIGSEFDELSRRDVTNALGTLASEMSEGRESEEDDEIDVETSQELEAAGFLDAFSSTITPFDLDRDGVVPLITISARSGTELTRICGQLLDVQALWLEMEDPPSLNEEVEVLLEIAGLGFEVALPGRVVHKAGRRTAIDISGLSPNDLDSIREVYEQHGGSEAEVDELTARPIPREKSVRMSNVGQSWDGRSGSSLALSRTFETVSQADPYWYGPQSRWLEPEEVGAAGKVRRDVDPENLLLEVAELEFTGLVEFAASDRQYQIYFNEGNVTDIAGRPYTGEEELGPMLRVADRVSDDELAEASSHAIKREISLELALYKLDVLPGDELKQSVAGRLTYLLRKICDFGEGTGQYTEADSLESHPLPAPEVRVDVPVESVIFRRRLDRFHQMSAEDRNGLINAHRDTYPDVSEGSRERIQRAFADDAHREMVEELVTGSRKLTDLIAESFLPPAETFSVLYALRSMNLVDFGARSEAANFVERFGEDVRVKHMSVHKASYFEVLNVHWSSYDDVVESAYTYHSEYFDPDRAPEGLDSKNRQRLQEISERIDSSYRILKQRKSRHGYRKKIMPKYKLKHGVPLLLERARLAGRDGRFDLARDAFARVLEIDPEHTEASREFETLRDRAGE